jgi:hypothetical protein
VQPLFGFFTLVRKAGHLGVDLCLPRLRMLDASKVLGDLAFHLRTVGQSVDPEVLLRPGPARR